MTCGASSKLASHLHRTALDTTMDRFGAARSLDSLLMNGADVVEQRDETCKSRSPRVDQVHAEAAAKSQLLKYQDHVTNPKS